MRLHIAFGKYLLAFLLVVVLCAGFTYSGHSQERGRTSLTLNQIEKLIQIGTSDSIIATEIRNRGIGFTPNRAIIEKLRQIGAGSQTLAALREIMPMLDEAKQKIPTVLKSIYKSLNDGNPRQVSHLLSSDLINDSQSLDRICRPFTYRAHYIESIIERPKQEFDARVRVLFQPIEENAYTLVFDLADDSFYLKGFRESDTDEWFRPWETEAKEIARKFIYAAKSGKQDVISHVATKNLNVSPLLTEYQEALQKNVIKIENLHADIVNYKGLKVEVKTESVGQWLGVDYLYWTFLVDRIDGENKIVKWEISKWGIDAEAEDSNLESYTLKRFGLFSSSSKVPSDETSVKLTEGESGIYKLSE